MDTRGWLWIAPFAAAVLGIVFVPQPSEATSCIDLPWQRHTRPKSGTEDFPIDGTIRVYLRGGYPDALEERLGEEYRLIDSEGERVGMNKRSVRDRLEFSPTEKLEPNSQYTLERVYTYDQYGVRVRDETRWAYAASRSTTPVDEIFPAGRWKGVDPHTLLRPMPNLPSSWPLKSVRRIWLPAVTFQTAGEEDVERDVSPLRIRNATWKQTGGRFRLEVTFEDLQGVRPTDVLELEIFGEGVVLTQPAQDLALEDLASPANAFVAGNAYCDPDPVFWEFSPGPRIRIRLADAASQRLSRTPWVKPVVEPKFPDPNWSRKVPALPSEHEKATVNSWLNLPLVENPVSPVPGAILCPYGFESAAHEWSKSHREEANTDVPIVVAKTIEETQTYAVTAEDISWTRPRPKIYISATNDHGDTKWRHSLPRGGYGHDVATRGGKLLAAWVRRLDVESDRLEWRIHDKQTGRIIEKGSRQFSSIGSHVSTASLDDGFAVAFLQSNTKEDNPKLLLLRGNPRVRDLQISSTVESLGKHFDLASNGSVIALTYKSQWPFAYRHDIIEVAFFDKNGRQIRAAVGVDRGLGLLKATRPRIKWISQDQHSVASEIQLLASLVGLCSWFDSMELLSGYFAVTWESGFRVYAAAVDSSGRVSPATALFDGRWAAKPKLTGVAGNTGPVTISHDAVTGQFLRKNVKRRLETLTCRKEPPPGAPQRIEILGDERE